MGNLRSLIGGDLIRYKGKASFRNAVTVYLRVPGFRFMLWHRVASITRQQNKLLYFLPWYMLTRLKYKYGYDIPAETTVGPGFYIGHFGGIVISSMVVIGMNCNISQGVTIGFNPRGSKKGFPKIGNKVYIAPGAKVIGGISIGDNAAIGANAVVIDDVPENAVVAGNPARIVSFKGSAEYIINQVD